MATIQKTQRRPWMAERKAQDRRMNDNSNFYHSQPWRKLRAQKIRQNPICEECENDGRIVVANVADHIVPINQGGGALDIENLQSLCTSCHNSKSGKEAHSR